MSNTVNSTKVSLDKRSLIQKMSSDIDHIEMDPSQFYFANDPRHPNNFPLQPLFKQRQLSHGVQGNIVRAPLSPSRSMDFSTGYNAQQLPPERQYHFLPGDDSEQNRSSTLPKSISRDGINQPYPGPQPPPRHNQTGPLATIGHVLLPFANSPKGHQGHIRDPLEKRGQQTFSTFLEDKHYETLEKRAAEKDTPASSMISFPASNPIMTDVKNMKVDDNDTIVRQITVTKKEKKYPINCLLFLCQLFTIVLVLGVAGVAVVALLEVKQLENSPITQAQALVTNLNDTVSELQSQIAILKQQISETNTSLDERVMTAEGERMELESQFQSLNSSVNNTIGSCIHTSRTCRAAIGSRCVPNGNNVALQVREGYTVVGVWCQGSLDNLTMGLDAISTMSTYVVHFPDLTPPAYECGCSHVTLSSEIYHCITNIVQCQALRN